jgi:hypothetical protein
LEKKEAPVATAPSQTRSAPQQQATG